MTMYDECVAKWGKPNNRGNFLPVTKTVTMGKLRYVLNLGLWQPGPRSEQRPHFSATCDIYEGRQDVGGGAAHEEMLKAWPESKTIIDLHLSDDLGSPMHDEANAWYWLSGYFGGCGEEYRGDNGSFGKSPAECLRIFSEHVRVSGDDLTALLDRVDNARHNRAPYGYPAMRAQLAEEIENMRPRWKAEADTAIEWLKNHQ